MKVTILSALMSNTRRKISSMNKLVVAWCTRVASACIAAAIFGQCVIASDSAGSEIKWQHLSSKRGEIPTPPGGSTQQTGGVVGDFDNNGLNDFIISFRQKPPALVWYRRAKNGWDLCVVEKDCLTVEAGGAVCDIDGDGQGGVRRTELIVGHGWHEARQADLDGDGDLDLLNKPYNWDTPRIDIWLNNGTGHACK